MLAPERGTVWSEITKAERDQTEGTQSVSSERHQAQLAK